MQPDPDHPTLSPRQAQIFAMLAEGFIYAEIAVQLGITLDAVKHYAQNARARLKARTMIEAVVIAERWGLIPVAPLVA